MTDFLLAIDPGKVTGWSYWSMDSDAPLHRLEYGLVKGGIEGFVTWAELRLGRWRPDVVVVERFVPEAGHATSEIDALEIQGALKTMASALALEVEWQLRDQKSQVRPQILKRAGLWFTPSQAKVDPEIDHEDGNDVNDSAKHALAYAKRHAHRPTQEYYWPDI